MLMAGVLLGLAPTAQAAELSPTAQIEVLNIAGNGMHGTYIRLAGFSFTGCAADAAFIEGGNLNYKEIIAALLAAKMADKAVQVVYSGCNNGYPVIREVNIR
jgi:hypothetical protein